MVLQVLFQYSQKLESLQLFAFKLKKLIFIEVSFLNLAMNNPSGTNDFPMFTMSNRGILLLSGIYTAVWAALFKWFGPQLFSWLSMQVNFDVSMPTGFYGTVGILSGIILLLSAFYPLSWIYLTAFGLFGKFVSVLTFLLLYMPDLEWNKRIAFHLFFNDILCLLLVGVMLWKAWQVKKYLKTLPE